METAIGKAIDLVCEYSVVPLARQVKYAFCYKSFISDMEKAGHELDNDKKLIEQSVDEAGNNLKVISGKAKEWLQEVDEAHKEVSNLYNTYVQDQATRSSCIGQIFNPIARHQLGRKATKKKQMIEELLLKKPKPEDIFYEPQASGIVNEASAAAAAARRIDNGVFQSSCWNEAINKIMKSLKDDTTNIIGMHGMGGVGKSTMINEVHLQVLEQCMFDEVAKVEVKAEVDIIRIQEEIACALGLTLEKHSATIRAQLLSKRLLKVVEKNEIDDKKNELDDKKNEMDIDEKKKVKKKTVLIILDDLWEKLELERVGIPSSNDQVQIKLLLTSRDEHLLSDKMGARDPIPLDVLSDADALRMFKSVVGIGDEDEGYKASKAAEIAPKCGGLPVVIMAIANALKNKVLKEWEDALQQLDVTDALSKLEVSYDYLPSEESKRLFLLCGIIRGPHIQVRDLLKYTFGLGLYERKDIYTLTVAATELDNLLSSLKAASMLLKSDDLGYVKIHDRMRDLALKIVDRDRSEWAHFTLRADRCKIPRRFDASTLELLFSYCGEGDSKLLVPHSFFKDMKRLYVLEFTNLNGAFSLPSPADQLLGSLETLCLHKCNLSDISMIGELKSLRILSFQGSDIRMIPMQIGELGALKMLDLSDCKELLKIEPNVLGSLTKLEELNMENSFKNWGIDQEDEAQPTNARLIELKNMTRLSNVRLHIPCTSMLPKDDQLFSSTLTVYKIMLGDGWSWDIDFERNESRVLMLNFDDPPSVLQQDWVQATLQRTEILYLRGSLDGKCESIDELCIKGFECLKHLRVRGCSSIRYIVSSNSGSNFSDLESLSLEVLENLEKFCNGETFSSKLKVIKVKDCNKLTHLFDFSMLKLNSKVEEIIIENCKEMHCIVIEDDNYYDVVELLKLQTLYLQYLPNFQAFCVPEGPQPPTKALFSGKKVAFLCLESLKMKGLDELEYIWHPTDPPMEFGKLRLLDVQSCNKLVCVTNSNVLTIHLESLTIGRCASIKNVFDLRYDYLLPGAGGFRLLKEIRISSCPEMESIIVVMIMGEEEETHQQVASIQYSSLKKVVVNECGKLKTFCWYYSCGKSDYNNIISASEQQPIDLLFFNHKETFPCLETLTLDTLQELRQIWHHEVVAAQGSFYNLKQVAIKECPQLTSVFPSTLMIECLHKLESIQVSRCKLMQSIIVDAAPRFGYDDKQDKSIPNLKFLNLWSLEKFTGIWNKGQSDDGSRSNRMTLQQELGGNMENRELCMRKLESLKLDDLPKLEWNIFISQKKCTIINNDNQVHPCDESIFFPSLQELAVKKCKNVRLFDSDSSVNQVQLDHHYSAIDQFLISSSKKATHPHLRSLAAEYNKEYVKLSFEQQKQRLHLTLTDSRSSSSSCMNVLSLNSPSFCNVLTRLTVELCDGLEYLLTPRVANSLVHLTYLTIEKCDKMKEVIGVGMEKKVVDINENRGEDEITFNNLKELTLEMVWNLESFSSSSVNLHFPSLENLTIFGCLRLGIFSNGGVLTTPKLHQVNWSRYNDEDNTQLTEDLNTTIQNKCATSGISSKGRRVSYVKEKTLKVNMGLKNLRDKANKLQKMVVEKNQTAASTARIHGEMSVEKTDQFVAGFLEMDNRRHSIAIQNKSAAGISSEGPGVSYVEEKRLRVNMGLNNLREKLKKQENMVDQKMQAVSTAQIHGNMSVENADQLVDGDPELSEEDEAYWYSEDDEDQSE